MARPWETLGSEPTAWGEIELRCRGEGDFLLTLDGRVVMTSSAHRSEIALAELATERLVGHEAPRVLLAGLGLGYTLRATLDGLGCVGDGAHADHEHIVIEPSLERCALLARLMLSPPTGVE